MGVAGGSLVCRNSVMLWRSALVSMAFVAAAVGQELARLTWECPFRRGGAFRSNFSAQNLTGDCRAQWLDATEVCLVSPFLDLTTVKAVAKWGGKGVRRTILSTPAALNAVAARDATAFDGHFHEVLRCGVPELLTVGCDPLADEPPLAVQTAEGEELPPSGLSRQTSLRRSGSESPIVARERQMPPDAMGRQEFRDRGRDRPRS